MELNPNGYIYETAPEPKAQGKLKKGGGETGSLTNAKKVSLVRQPRHELSKNRNKRRVKVYGERPQGLNPTQNYIGHTTQRIVGCYTESYRSLHREL